MSDYTYEDIDYAGRFVLRVATQQEREVLRLPPEYTWIYESGRTQLYLTTEEAVKFVQGIGDDVETYRRSG
jgi:hypothetical protein